MITSRLPILPITSLPILCKLNDINFVDTAVESLSGDRGCGLVSEKALNSEDTFDRPTLLIIPKELLLCAESVEEAAKVDVSFRDLLILAGGKSRRRDVMLFLLMQITIAVEESKGTGNSPGVPNVWTEYVKILPRNVPVPTSWSEAERMLLTGTSLESALNAKLAALIRELEELRELTGEIPWCNKSWWGADAPLHLSDWILIDSWWRSRSLELPNLGESMVPCLDMANHSLTPNAYYEETSTSDVALLLRPAMKVDPGSELTISYGTSKTPAEMLFSYGFTDSSSTTSGLTLSIEPFPDDPLGKAKLAIFPGPPIVRIFTENDLVRWESAFIYLLCLNEEDGLEFKVLQQTDGSHGPLNLFWQKQDVSERAGTFESLIAGHPLENIFELRAMVLLHDIISQQLNRLENCERASCSTNSSTVSPERQKHASMLRSSEATLLGAALQAVDNQKSILLRDDKVLQFLASVETDEQPESSTEDDDFS